MIGHNPISEVFRDVPFYNLPYMGIRFCVGEEFQEFVAER